MIRSVERVLSRYCIEADVEAKTPDEIDPARQFDQESVWAVVKIKGQECVGWSFAVPKWMIEDDAFDLDQHMDSEFMDAIGCLIQPHVKRMLTEGKS